MSHYSDAYEFDNWTKKHPEGLPGDDYKGALSDEERYTAFVGECLKTQVGGDHYKKLKIQPIEYILANDLGYVEGNIIKYITRWKDKGGVQDLEKIKHYCDFLIEESKK